MPTILLVDDEPSVLRAFLARLARPTDVLVARSGAEALRAATEAATDVVLLNVTLPDRPGLDVYRDLRRLDARVPVILVASSAAVEPAVTATREGAFDYLFKPVELPDLERTLRAALDASRLARTPVALPDSDSADDTDALVGRSPLMREVHQAIGRIAGQDAAVLIVGEPGTGKQLVARAIYQHSHRADGPFRAIHCAAFPEPFLDSELFGHEKGVFVGSDRKRAGKLEQCHGGTLFLDEVSELPPSIQAKLLRFLQDGRFERVGGNETISADVRVIAATDRDLVPLAADGRFRADLSARLGAVTVRIPPLRERGDDIDLLVTHALRRLNHALDKDVREVSPEAAGLLRAYSWPGNVRELQSVLKQAILRASGQVLLAEFLPEPLRVPAASTESSGLEEFVRERLAAGTEDLWEEVARRIDEVLLPLVLAHTGGNQQQAARHLGVARQTLRDRLRALGLHAARPTARQQGSSH